MTMRMPSSPATGVRSSSSTHKKPELAAASIMRFLASKVAGFLGFAAKNRFKTLPSDEYCIGIIQYSFRNFNTVMNNFLTIYVKFMTFRHDPGRYFRPIVPFNGFDPVVILQKQQKFYVSFWARYGRK